MRHLCLKDALVNHWCAVRNSSKCSLDALIERSISQIFELMKRGKMLSFMPKSEFFDEVFEFRRFGFFFVMSFKVTAKFAFAGTVEGVETGGSKNHFREKALLKTKESNQVGKR